MTAPSEARDLGDGRGLDPAALGRFLFPPVLVLLIGILTPAEALHGNQGDVNLYLEKAAAFAAGGVPYRDFPFEYPPGALVPMLVPYLLWPFGTVELDAYKVLFAGWEAALLLLVGVTLARIVRLGGDAEAVAGLSTRERLRRSATRLSILTAGAALAITWRFDLYPALLLLVALWAALDGRPGAAGIALGLGFLAKLFPVAILPALAVPWLVPFDLRQLARLALSFGGAVVVGLVPFIALAGAEPTFQFLRYNAERGLQVETIGGGLAILSGLLTGNPVDYDFRFSSVNVKGDFAALWLGLLPFATAVGFGAIAWLGWRRIRVETAGHGGVRPSTIVELATLCILMLLVTAKVYSIQYVVWFVPLVALLTGRRFWLAAAVVGLTMPIHPILYEGIVTQQALPILVLNLRNALLVTLLAWLLRDLASPPREPPRDLPRERAGQPKASPSTAASGLKRP